MQVATLYRDLLDDIDNYSTDPDKYLDVPFVPTDENVVEAMLNLGCVGPKDVLYDLGSGDGRIVIAAARDRDTRGIGIEIDPVRIADAMEYAGWSGVEYLVDFIEEDIFTADISKATVVTLYLLESINAQLRPRLLSELRPGTRIVSHAFDMGDWKPDRKVTARGSGIFLWVVPAKVAGTWCWQTAEGRQYRLVLEQRYQRLNGEVWVDDEPAELQAALLWGDLLELVIQCEGAYEPESIIMHCGAEQLLVVGEYQKGIAAHKVAA